MNNMCTIHPTPALCLLEVSRRPRTARKTGYVVYEHTKNETKVLNYEDTEAAKMEAKRQPRRSARMKKRK